ncbi:MAG: hypothetical protein CMB45_02955 [Euryarchaeota archaeon]|nr:hypothetical protein [Euryarchaeota archaeon]|tara:strand:+ start:8845 stop:9708 length:864 start_codon:yes stop_codon:yes gene_type:complete
MSQHYHLLNQYKPSIGTKLTYPEDSQFLNSTDDPWEFQPGYTTVNDENKAIFPVLWEKSGRDVVEYKRLVIQNYGANQKPFTKSTMMVAPVEWRTGYDDSTSLALTQLASLQGEAIRVKDAIGMVNNSIQRLEGLYEQNRVALRGKMKLNNNQAYMELADAEAPEVLATLKSDIATLRALDEGYSNQLSVLRTDARVLNQELESLLRNYKENANMLNINDNFASELERATKKAAGSGTIRGFTFGSIGGVLATGALVFLIAQARRAPRRVRSTRRGADGLFFRAPPP